MSNKSWRRKKNSKKMKKPAKRTKKVNSGAKQVEEVKKEEPKVLANLPDNLLLNIMKKCDEDTLETMMEESPVCRKLFEDNEGQFAPPAWMSEQKYWMYLYQVQNNGAFQYDCKIEEGLSKSPCKKDVSWQWIIRHLKGTYSLTFSYFKTIPYFLEPDYVTGVAFTPRQFYSSLKKFLAPRHFCYLDFNCYQPIPLDGYIKEWQRGKREIRTWTFGFPHQKAGQIEKYRGYDGKSELEVDYCLIDNMPHVVLMPSRGR